MAAQEYYYAFVVDNDSNELVRFVNSAEKISSSGWRTPLPYILYSKDKDLLLKRAEKYAQEMPQVSVSMDYQRSQVYRQILCIRGKYGRPPDYYLITLRPSYSKPKIPENCDGLGSYANVQIFYFGDNPQMDAQLREREKIEKYNETIDMEYEMPKENPYPNFTVSLPQHFVSASVPVVEWFYIVPSGAEVKYPADIQDEIEKVYQNSERERRPKKLVISANPNKPCPFGKVCARTAVSHFLERSHPEFETSINRNMWASHTLMFDGHGKGVYQFTKDPKNIERLLVRKIKRE